MNRAVNEATCKLALRAELAADDLIASAHHALLDRRRALRDDGERGAQAAEYAMLGGVSAAACSGLVALLKNRQTLKTLVDAVLASLGKVVEGWF